MINAVQTGDSPFHELSLEVYQNRSKSDFEKSRTLLDSKFVCIICCDRFTTTAIYSPEVNPGYYRGVNFCGGKTTSANCHLRAKKKRECCSLNSARDLISGFDFGRPPLHTSYTIILYSIPNRKSIRWWIYFRIRNRIANPAEDSKIEARAPLIEVLYRRSFRGKKSQKFLQVKSIKYYLSAYYSRKYVLRFILDRYW